MVCSVCAYFKACLFPNSPPMSHLKFDLQILHIFISLNGYFRVENVCLETSSTQQSSTHDWLAGQSCFCSFLFLLRHFNGALERT